MHYYVTTPIYYVNARPHLGHAYTTIVNDVLTRYHRLAGYDSYFLTGTDEHGDKIVRAAEKEGCSPQDYADHISGLFRATWPELSIENNDFIRTTEKRHKDVVSRFMDLVNSKGDIYFGEYGGYYCFGCERFYTEKELVDGQCPDHLTKPDYIAEKNYFFRMGNYQDWLLDHIAKNPDFIRPERYRNEVLGFLREPLEDLCISRPKSRLTWGINVPFDDNYVTYVWFDALINYISALGWPDSELFSRYWPVAQHTIAKDILKPHAIFWPTMLQSAGLSIYRHLNVHGYWQIGESKMSKSVGNVVEALSMAQKYGSEAFRYFLMRDMNFGLDSEFSEDRLVERYNADLANDLGNLWQRSLTMLQKFSGAVVPAVDPLAEAAYVARVDKLVAGYREAFENVNPRAALGLVWEFVSFLNRDIDSEAPWALARNPEEKPHLEAFMARLINGLAVTGVLIWPVMPKTGQEIWTRLGLDLSSMSLEFRNWSGLLAHGHPLKAGQAIFPRVEVEGVKEDQKVPKIKPQPAKPRSKKLEPAESITFEEFARLDLRVAKVVSAEPVSGSDKLLKLSVNIDGNERTIVAGLAKHFQASEMVGRLVVVVANLAPAKLMGIESKGMVLAASGDEKLVLLTVSNDIPAGAKVS